MSKYNYNIENLKAFFRSTRADLKDWMDTWESEDNKLMVKVGTTLQQLMDGLEEGICEGIQDHIDEGKSNEPKEDWEDIL